MAICILIKESELEDTVRLLGTEDYVYKFMYDSNNKDEYHEDYLGLNKIIDCNIFSESFTMIKSLKIKTKGAEVNHVLNNIVVRLFDDERHLVLLHDYKQYKNVVVVFGNKYVDISATQKEMNLTVTDEQLDTFFEYFKERMHNQEGMRMYTLDDYRTGMKLDLDRDYTKFIERQRDLVIEDQLQFKKDMKKHFDEAFKFRLIAYYSKLKEFSLEEIMDEMWKRGFLDDRFSGECFVYDDLARQYLARRLCTISFKKDIEVLMKKGIIDTDAIKYDIGINI